jgi:hypothetical protein
VIPSTAATSVPSPGLGRPTGSGIHDGDLGQRDATEEEQVLEAVRQQYPLRQQVRDAVEASLGGGVHQRLATLACWSCHLTATGLTGAPTPRSTGSGEADNRNV